MSTSEECNHMDVRRTDKRDEVYCYGCLNTFFLVPKFKLADSAPQPEPSVQRVDERAETWVIVEAIRAIADVGEKYRQEQIDYAVELVRQAAKASSLSESSS